MGVMKRLAERPTKIQSKAPSNNRSVYFVVQGMTTLEKDLNSFEPKLRKKALSAATRESAKVVLEHAKRLAPIDEGDLKKSLKVRSMAKTTRKAREKKVGHSVQVGKGWFKGDSFYAAFVEFGTRNMAARPYLRPAVKASRSQARLIFRRKIREAIASLKSTGKVNVARMTAKELKHVVDG